MKKLLLIIISALLLFGCKHNSAKWPDGKIPFRLVGFSLSEAVEIYKCMYLWETASGNKVEFKDMAFSDIEAKHPLYITKVDPDNIIALTTVGYGRNNLCALPVTTQRVVLHELGHSLVLIYEHTRYDRNLYITINWDNVLPCFYSLFSYLNKPSVYDYQDYPYDYDSVMHYGKDLCGFDSIDAHGNEIGSETISIIDALKVSNIYKNREEVLE